MDSFAGIDVNAPDVRGFTAIHKSCLIGDFDTTERLIVDGKADPFQTDSHGRNAAYFATLNIKAFHHMACESLAKGGMDLAAYSDPALDAMTGARALELCKTIFKATTATS
ncbi:hypothetical protein WJX74_010440 [Apatococcus lobatus]|uniref:Uncharacterized protein n=1 Tax=Apatococcus lobatus TaxID=904363 RepID=A0AAW1R079_9CHLO